MSQTMASATASRTAEPAPAAGARVARHARAHRRRLEVVAAFALYLGFACYLTWPLVSGLSHTLYGAPGDPYGTIAFLRELVDYHHNPFLPGTIQQVGAPQGIPVPWPRDLASAPETLTLYVLTELFGAIAAFGLYTLAGYTLTGVATFLLARRLTGNAWAALIAGWAYAFYPFAAINGQGHLDFVHGWLLALAVWRMLELMWTPTRRNGVLAGLAVSLCMWWSPYFILFGGFMYVVVTCVSLLRAWRGRLLRATLGPQAFAAAIVCVFLAGLGVLATRGAAEGIGVRTHAGAELNFFSARPLEFLLPDVQSPVFGGDARSILAKYPLKGVGIESTLYLGISVMLLALVAFAAFVRRRLPARLRGPVLALSCLALAGAIASMPPEAHVLGVQVYFPSHFVALLTSTWRVYTRFVMVVMLALALLAAIGLDALARPRGRRAGVALMALATLVVPLDLWTSQHKHVERISVPGIYKTLARLPRGPVVEYPLASSGLNTYSDIFFQSAYDKPLLNGFQENSYQERVALSVSVLSAPTTAPRLATLGIRYVLLDAKPAAWPGWPEAGKPGAGYRLIAHEPYANLYLVTAHPQTPAMAGAAEGFGGSGPSEVGTATWLENPSGTVEVAGKCHPCKGVLTMKLISYARTHEVWIRDADGHLLAQKTVGTPVPVKIPLRFYGKTILHVTATPGPQPDPESPGNHAISIAVVNPEFESTAR